MPFLFFLLGTVLLVLFHLEDAVSELPFFLEGCLELGFEEVVGEEEFADFGRIETDCLFGVILEGFEEDGLLLPKLYLFF